ncbi:MAG: tubulin-like doman-containing protein [Pirellulales bacterium]
MTTQLPVIEEPFPGYKVVERIGAGGYGEVWKAIAPGGLSKAIKFIYGNESDDRAVRELGALNRVKEVRHPFLLSLERIEIIAGQLVIVTELAEMSLKDRYLEHRAQDRPGIPRDELLGYLRDAAEALDYMSEHRSLQHLDVKPENLLLVGGRVKVADFGLVKDLGETSVSLIGGLTPRYAAPEVFDGQPGRHSDQYSLAVVYHEMLTGSTPFSGKTPAQLTSQHLHAPPNLSALSPDDRNIIARALNKRPHQRFSSCAAMIEALSNPGRAASPSVRAAAPGAVAAAVANGRCKQADKSPCDELNDTTRTPVAVPSVLTTTPPPISLPEEDLRLGPALIVGVGGTAGSVLRRFRQCLSERFGRPEDLPAVDMLLLDTDVKALLRATQGDSDIALDPRQTLAMPLRQLQNYREDSARFLQWISRRWLYNIPRSMRTEGRRPLGRLALMDHSQELRLRAQAALTRLIDPATLELSSERGGLQFTAERTRIFIVASISGGTGGGMALDLARAMQKLLASAGLPADGVRVVLTHSTGRATDARDLAIANAHATLTELNALLQYGADYGDDAHAVWPDLKVGDVPFPPTYLVDFGDGLDDAKFGDRTESVARYLYLNTAAPGGAFLEKCRHSDRQGAETEYTSLRTFSVCQPGGVSDAAVQELSELTARELLKNWAGAESESDAAMSSPGAKALAALAAEFSRHVRPTDALAKVAASHLQELGISFERLAETFDQAVNGARPSEWNDAGAHPDHVPSAEQPEPKAEAEHDASRLLLPEQQREAGPSGTGSRKFRSPRMIVDELAAELVREHGGAIESWLNPYVEGPHPSLGTAERLAHRAVDYLNDIAQRCSEIMQERREELQEAESVSDDDSSIGRPYDMAAWHGGTQTEAETATSLSDCNMNGDEDAVICFGVARTARALQETVGRLAKEFRELRRQVEGWWAAFEAPPEKDASEQPVDRDAAGADHAESHVAESIQQILPALVETLGVQVRQNFLDLHGGLRSLIGRAQTPVESIVEAIRHDARTVVLEAVRKSDLGGGLLGEQFDADTWANRMRGGLDQGSPRIVSCGGARRLLLAGPPGDNLDKIHAALCEHGGQSVTRVPAVDGRLILCQEVSGIPLTAVAMRLIQHRRDFAEVAARLHTRVDLRWPSLYFEA